MQHILALSRSAVVVRHWFEIDLELFDLGPRGAEGKQGGLPQERRRLQTILPRG